MIRAVLSRTASTRRRAVIPLAVALLCLCIACELDVKTYAQQHPAPKRYSLAVKSASGKWRDQKDGTLLNPILPGDLSDLYAIRVGDDFYAISSTMQYSPGMAVLHSTDLVNWQIIGHVVNDLTALDPELGGERMNRDGRGI